MTTFSLELIALVPWDDQHRGVPSAQEDYPQFGFVVPEQMRRIRSLVRVRLDDRGGYHLLGESGGILHLRSGGAVAGRTPLPLRTARVIDYACHANGGCVLLELFSDAAGLPVNRLRSLDASGGERWSRTGPVQVADRDVTVLRGTFGRLLSGGGQLYLSAEHHGAEVAEIDADTGRVRHVVRQREDSGAVFLAAGRLLSVFFDAGSNQRGIAMVDPAGKEIQDWHGGGEHFAWLVHPFGADDRKRVYVWRQGRIARISLRGEIEELNAIDGIAVQEGDHQLFTSHAVDSGVAVASKDGQTVLAASPGYSLVRVDSQGRYYLFGGELPGHAGELRTYSAGGQFESSASHPQGELALECRVPPPDAWQVDASGRIVVPVVTPEGVALVGLRAG